MILYLIFFNLRTVIKESFSLGIIRLITRVSQKFCNISSTYSLYSSRSKKNIQSRGHRGEIFWNHLSVPWSYVDTSSFFSGKEIPSLKLQRPLGCWSAISARSGLWIGTRNYPQELGPDYRLDAALVQFPQVPCVYSENWLVQILQNLWLHLTRLSRLIFFDFNSVVRRDSKIHNTTGPLFYCLLIIIKSGLLTGIRWFVCYPKVSENFIGLILCDGFWFVHISYG